MLIFRFLNGDSAPRHGLLGRALRSDRSPLHDVRYHARRAAEAGARGFVISQTSSGRRQQRNGVGGKMRLKVHGGVPAPSGGARRDRTDDLLLAKQALSQLSYGPLRGQISAAIRSQSSDAFLMIDRRFRFLELVGLGRFELPTSRLSSARSNQLSYKPEPGVNDQKSIIRTPIHSDYRPPITDC